MMELNEYQEQAGTTNIYPHGPVGLYAEVMGLCSEAGEVAGKAKKVIRDNDGDIHGYRAVMLAELGDVLWYVSQVADRLGVSLENLAVHNLGKLQARQERGAIGGSGDER